MQSWVGYEVPQSRHLSPYEGLCPRCERDPASNVARNGWWSNRMMLSRSHKFFASALYLLRHRFHFLISSLLFSTNHPLHPSFINSKVQPGWLVLATEYNAGRVARNFRLWRPEPWICCEIDGIVLLALHNQHCTFQSKTSSSLFH